MNKNNEKITALVMFSDSTSLWGLRFLKRGFRHCFVALSVNDGWIVYEPLLSRTEITVIPNMTAEQVRKGFESMGCSVCYTSISSCQKYKRKFRLRPFSCVEATKRVLGIQRSLWTPYQLYQFINQKG